jgi:hypothetical protein
VGGSIADRLHNRSRQSFSKKDAFYSQDYCSGSHDLFEHGDNISAPPRDLVIADDLGVGAKLREDRVFDIHDYITIAWPCGIAPGAPIGCDPLHPASKAEVAPMAKA